MNKEELKHKEIVEFCHANSDESVLKKYSRYFKEGYDAYGIDSKTIESQKTKWLDSWKNEMTIDDYMNLGDILISTGKFEEADFAIQFIVSCIISLFLGFLGGCFLWLGVGFNPDNSGGATAFILGAILMSSISIIVYLWNKNKWIFYGLNFFTLLVLMLLLISIKI